MYPQSIPLHKNAKDLTNYQFGRLIALAPVRHPVNNKLMWFCQCNCGNVTIARPDHLVRGMIVSCGCYRINQVASINERHGMFGTKIYSTWTHINQRCYNPNDSRYKDYGERGIEVYDEWRLSFESFLDYVRRLPCYDRAGCSLDRIDNNGNYEPGNVRWATRTEQARNTRRNHLIEYDGKTQCLRAWEDEKNLRHGQLWERLHRGWSVERALATPRNVRRTQRHAQIP